MACCFVIVEGRTTRGRILILAISLSAIFHTLLLASPAFLHWPPMPPQQSDAGISIDLETLAPYLPASSLELQSDAADPEKLPIEQDRTTLPPKPEKDRAPAPGPAKPPRKKTARTARTRTAGWERETHAKPDAAAKPKGETRQPRPSGGAFSPQPAYPDLARKRGQEGVVSIRCHIDPSGKVINAAIAQSSGFRLLDEAALKSLRQWKFVPALKDGAPVAGSLVVPVRFQLR